MSQKRDSSHLLQEDDASRYLRSLSPEELREYGSEEYGLDGLPDVPDTFTAEEVEAGWAACGFSEEPKAPE